MSLTRYYIGCLTLFPVKVTGNYVKDAFYDDDGFLVDEYLFNTREEATDFKISELKKDIKILEENRLCK